MPIASQLPKPPKKVEMFIPDDRIDVQAIVQAMQDYADARAEHEKARNEYEGYSWGYHGSGYINAMDRAAVEFGNRLDAYVDGRIKAALAKQP